VDIGHDAVDAAVTADELTPDPTLLRGGTVGKP
jgi:hypothetical protein